MSDSRLQDLERAWQASRSREDEVLYLGERVRAGELTEASLELAAYCGHEAAVSLLGRSGAPSDTEGWITGLAGFEPSWVVPAAFSLLDRFNPFRHQRLRETASAEREHAVRLLDRLEGQASLAELQELSLHIDRLGDHRFTFEQAKHSLRDWDRVDPHQRPLPGPLVYAHTFLVWSCQALALGDDVAKPLLEKALWLLAVSAQPGGVATEFHFRALGQQQLYARPPYASSE
ncbi:MAG: hypothetical protein R3F62_05465 [Planctomycetota bacterium]